MGDEHRLLREAETLALRSGEDVRTVLTREAMATAALLIEEWPAVEQLGETLFRRRWMRTRAVQLAIARSRPDRLRQSGPQPTPSPDDPPLRIDESVADASVSKPPPTLLASPS